MTLSGFEIYTDFVKSLVDAEASRKSSIESKGISVITTSGTLVTLLFGLVAVVTSHSSFTLPVAAHGWLVAAVLAFVVAAALAILVSFPLPYGQTDLTVNLLRDWWGDSESVADAAVVQLRLDQLAAARRMNVLKVTVLCLASGAELVGLIMLTVAVIRIVGA